MYVVNKFCYLCLSDKDQLKEVFECDKNGEKYHEKLTTSLVDMEFSEISENFLICTLCCKTLDVVYEFWKTCSKSKQILKNYLSRLHSAGNVRGEVKIFLPDIQKELKNHLTKKINGEIKVDEISEKNFGRNFEDSQIEDVARNEDAEDGIKEERSKACTVIVDQIKNRNDNTFEEIVIKIEWDNEIEENEEIKIEDQNDSDTCDDENYEGLSIQKEEMKNEEQEEDILESISEEADQKLIYDSKNENCLEDTKKTRNELKTRASEPKVAPNGSKMYPCPICLSLYHSRTGLREHLVKHSRPHECKTCGKVFTRKSNLERHLEIHSRSFKCNVCGKVFRDNALFKKHGESHRKVRKIQCNYCGKMFTRLGDLTKHSSVHTGVKPFKCPTCDKVFSRKDCLANHLRTHTNEKPFKCKICQKAFNQRGNLTKHSFTHNGLRPYECETCKKGFKQKTHLTSHSVTHLQDKNFKCGFCRGKFGTNEELERHLAAHEARKSKVKI